MLIETGDSIYCLDLRFFLDEKSRQKNQEENKLQRAPGF
jgi:hypothetical protein